MLAVATDCHGPAKIQSACDNSRTRQFQGDSAGVLDIGSGCGTLLAELHNGADYPEGWEPAVPMSKYANDHFANSKTKFTSGLSMPGTTEQKLDLITMSQVLEHVPHLGVFLAKLRRFIYHKAVRFLLRLQMTQHDRWQCKL